MSHRVDIAGEKFGKLTAVCFSGTRNRHTLWKCVCDCGNITKVFLDNLRNGTSKSCGCQAKPPPPQIKHGKSDSPTYRSWEAMKRRCYCKKDKAFKDYGGRGIRVCARWRNSFGNFLKDMGIRPRNKTIDRIENNGNYEPRNCRWSTPLQQNRNTRKSIAK